MNAPFDHNLQRQIELEIEMSGLVRDRYGSAKTGAATMAARLLTGRGGNIEVRKMKVERVTAWRCTDDRRVAVRFIGSHVKERSHPKAAPNTLCCNVGGLWQFAGINRSADSRELGVQRGAERGGADHDGERDESGDQTILDSCSARFVLHKVLDESSHWVFLFAPVVTGRKLPKRPWKDLNK